ncbi:MFS transporter [Sphingomonas japonica]|uniref:Maltose/moltooligosaccharide transporter n=1 Tax=Sphingomonas japonica TaxID=511662 RepID=A0ABX0U2G3_9SPHN|nr:MFS transporter [Sphingomonas japonica]NIJ23557.1 maltose/moltooligosaccharide transporter [Sphingomonas japonica]
MDEGKPRQGFGGLWTISFGFFGVQIGFALQNANASRIFQALGTPIDDLAIMWMAAPLTGLLVQPIIGHYSDRTWTRLGRRRPYFLVGAILCTIALCFMPNSPAIWAAAITLWILDASLNVTMEPFRAFVGDMLRRAQRPAGYAFQTAFIGAGAVAASLAPAILTWAGVSNVAPLGSVPDTVRYSFYIGAAALLAAVLWTVLGTREYAPEEMARFAAADGEAPPPLDRAPLVAPATGPWWLVAGAIAAAVAWALGLANEAYLVAGGLAAFGIAQIAARRIVARGATDNVLAHVVSDLATMPETMRRLALVQFFTWGALIIMWIYTTPVVALQAFGASDPASAAYNEAGNWVGVLFAIYSGVATLGAFLLPKLSQAIGKARTHILGLLCGAAGFVGLYAIHDASLLIAPMIGIGIAWASILTMPYVILADALPQHKLGVYMGIFNFFVVLPQLIVAALMGAAITALFPATPQVTMLIAATVMTIAAAAMLRVKAE